jgi:adenylate cyclase
VQTGVVHIGTTMGADEGIADVRAIGNNVNVAAGLASQADAGQALISDAAWTEAGRTANGLEHRSVELKGKSVSIRVYVMEDSPAVRDPVLQTS